MKRTTNYCISVFDRFNGLFDIDVLCSVFWYVFRFTRSIHSNSISVRLHFSTATTAADAATVARVHKSMFILLIHFSNGVLAF